MWKGWINLLSDRRPSKPVGEPELVEAENLYEARMAFLTKKLGRRPNSAEYFTLIKFLRTETEAIHTDVPKLVNESTESMLRKMVGGSVHIQGKVRYSNSGRNK